MLAIDNDAALQAASSASEKKGKGGEKPEDRGVSKKRKGWNGLTYTTRVTLSFALIAAMTALVAIGVVSFVWEQHFQTYTRDNMESIASITADQIADNYADSGAFDGETIMPARTMLAMTPGIGIRVVNNTVAYDAESPVSIPFDSTRLSTAQAGASGTSLAPKNPSPEQMATAAIEVDGQAVGSVNVWVLGSDTLLRSADEQFRNNSYQAMAIATIVAIVLASCCGYLFARGLVNPINRITKTAKAIKEGNLSARTGLSGGDEIAELGQTFDEMAESVEKDRELERRLTTDVAHELRTPLMAIQSTVEAMVDGVFEADQERLETVNSEVQRLGRLVSALLSLSRLENRSTPMKEEVVNVGDLISSIVATHEAFVADSGLSLTYEMEKNVLVKGDADMIRQATANLISNAVRYTPEGGHITVKVSRGDIMAAISVRDTGIGLTPEECKMVFSRFWRADAGRARASGGLGIGLAVVKEIVDRHHGWVQVEGKKDEGACFTIHLPLYDPEVEARQNAKSGRTGRQKPVKPKGSKASKEGKSRKSRER
ncbi:MAG: HAMP domain-containing sensor histidine kinase [Eggerthellaceae bacterium]|nr:HAMP domain-containing sensor histidine kinase [Eggerthellaceae bacterium]